MSHVSHTISVHLTWCGYTILPYQYSYRCPIILESTKESITKQCYRFLYYCSLIITSSAARRLYLLRFLPRRKQASSWQWWVVKLSRAESSLYWSGWKSEVDKCLGDIWYTRFHQQSPPSSLWLSHTKDKRRKREKGCLRARIGYTIKPWIVATPILLNSLYSTVIYSLSLEPDADKYETHSSLLNR